MHKPSEWREPTQQYVGDDSGRPDVHLQAITAHKHTTLLSGSCNICLRFQKGGLVSAISPGLSDDLRRHICGRPTHGVERPLHHRRQAKVTQLQ